MLAATKTSPPAVTIEPPRFGEPAIGAGMPGNWTMPSGTSHRFAPVERAIAASLPHGGAPHGLRLGERRMSRYMANGVPDGRANSPLSRFFSPSSLAPE